MSENAPLMALIRSEFKKLKEALPQRSQGSDIPGSLETRLDAIENGLAELFEDHRQRTGQLARAIGIIHAKLTNSEPLPEDLLRAEIFRDFMDNYPASAVPAYNVERHTQLAQDMAGWSDEQFAARKRDKEAQIAEGKFDPLDAYKAKVILDLYSAEQARRAERDRLRAIDKDR